MLKFRTGNIVDSDAQTLVNTVNCVGVMGKGVALEFKRKYPGMFRDYVRRCKDGRVLPGVPYVYVDHRKQIVNFPTKSHWKASSKIQDIEHGLEILRDSFANWNIRSIALPALGCGNGGLEWAAVRPLIVRFLSKLPIDVQVYEPGGRTQWAAAEIETSRPDLTGEQIPLF